MVSVGRVGAAHDPTHVILCEPPALDPHVYSRLTTSKRSPLFKHGSPQTNPHSTAPHVSSPIVAAQNAAKKAAQEAAASDDAQPDTVTPTHPHPTHRLLHSCHIRTLAMPTRFLSVSFVFSESDQELGSSGGMECVGRAGAAHDLSTVILCGRSLPTL